jgi:lipopolysaccharide export system protein LptA
MKINRNNLKRSACILAALLTSVSQAQMAGVEVSSFRVPEYDSEGAMTSQLFGESAAVGEDGEININKLRVEFYKDGKTIMEVVSPYCFYNQKTREAHSDAPVAADMERVQVRGQGFTLKPGDNAVRILNDCKVTIEGIMQKVKSDTPLSGNRGTNDVTVITSKELFLNYKARTVRFEQDVHVQDPKMVMDSGTLEVRFGEKNEINWIEALTNVRILNEGREANAGKAVYDVKTDEFLLEDNPSFKDGKNMLFGDRVRLWRASGRMVCEPRARLVIYPDKGVKTDLFEK